MTRRHLRLSLNVDLVEEETDEPPPSFDAEVEGSSLDEPSRIVPSFKPVLAKCGAIVETRRRAAR